MTLRNFRYLLLIVLICNCSSNINDSRCNFLLNLDIYYEVNLNLPQYSDLNFVSNSVYIPDVGNGGIIIVNAGTGFLAWDASDPNHGKVPCSILNINGLEATSSCAQQNSYSLITGQSVGTVLNCTLKAYRVESAGNVLIISSF